MTFEDAGVRRLAAAVPLLIGRGAQCGLRISNWRVGRQHARLVREDADIVLEDLGTLAGTMVNGVRVVRHAPVLPDDDILIGPCRLRVQWASSGAVQQADARASEPNGLVALVAPQPASAAQTSMAAQPASPQRLHERLQERLQERRRLHAALLEGLDLRRRDVAGMSDGTLRAEAERLLTQIVATDADLAGDEDKAALCREVLDEAVGLGPLEPLLAAPDITEIMVNRYDEIYVERAGRLWRHPAAFTSEQSVRWVIERIVTPLGRRIDESSPMVDALSLIHI